MACGTMYVKKVYYILENQVKKKEDKTGEDLYIL